MPREGNKLRNVADITDLDGSSVRRLCSSSVLERRQAAVQEVFRRAAAWDSQCQDYACKLRRQWPNMVLRCSETAPDPSLPVCCEICLPPGVGAEVLAAPVQKDGMTATPPDDLVNLLQEGLAKFCAQEFDNVAIRAAACVTRPLISTAPALQPPSTMGCSCPCSPLEPHAVPVQDVSVKCRIRGGNRWRTSSSPSTLS